MATLSSVLAWRIPWTEEPGGYSPWGCTQLDAAEATEHRMAQDALPAHHLTEERR